MNKNEAIDMANNITKIIGINNGWKYSLRRFTSDGIVRPKIKTVELKLSTLTEAFWGITVEGDGSRKSFNFDSKTDFEDLITHLKVPKLEDQVELIKKYNFERYESFIIHNYKFICYENRRNDIYIAYEIVEELGDKVFKTYEILNMIDLDEESMIGRRFKQVGGLENKEFGIGDIACITKYSGLIGFGSEKYSNIRIDVYGFEEWVEVL